MIYDSFNNIQTFSHLSEDISRGLSFLEKVPSDIEVGSYEISPRVRAIVSEYCTKKENENGYETHKCHIDIQYVIKGEETVRYLPSEKLRIVKPYCNDSDIAFYEPIERYAEQYIDMMIGNGYFSIFFPHDGHMPQLCKNEPKSVKKIVVKVKI